MHLILMKCYVQHDADCFRTISFMLHFRVWNNNRQIGLVPRGKHTEQTGLANNITVKISNRKPNRVFRFVADVNSSFLFFLIGCLLKSALKHNLRLIKPIGEKRSIFFSLPAQYNFFPLISSCFIWPCSPLFYPDKF